MVLIVQKYGGTSVGSVDRIQAVAQRIQRTVKEGNQVVVVVSAMGKTTDGLVNLARQISENPSRREMDMLLATGEQVSIALVSMALQELGQPAISLTGAQVGIVTEKSHSRARILEIKTDRMERHLEEGKVVVVAGFQGISDSEELEITTLGRGGSDTSAVALAAALKASKCEIYTDVPGVFTTDPRLVPEAQVMREITCDEMLELASLGAKVLHPRAVEIARNYGVPLVVLSSWSDEPGTRVISPTIEPRPIENLEIIKAVNGVEFDTRQAKVALLRIPDRPGIAAQLFGAISGQNVDVDLIIQSIHEGNTNDIAFTVSKELLNQAQAVTEAIAPAFRSQPSARDEAEVLIEDNMAKIAITGVGIIGRPEILAQMFAALAEGGINIEMISTSEVKVSCTIAEADCAGAIAILTKTFAIETAPLAISAHIHSNTNQPPVRGVALDRNQARLAIRYVPDRPGLAAKIFGLLALEKISVDTIIQSQRCRIVNGVPCRDLVFTLARSDANNAVTVLTPKLIEWGCGEVSIEPEVVKVSAVGSGMVGYPGVAAQMFAALAEEGINILAIATSEIKISCIVAETDGIKALQTIHRAFGLAGN